MSSLKKLEIDDTAAREHLNTSNWEALEALFNAHFKLTLNETTGAPIPFEYCDTVLDLFRDVLKDITKIADREEQLQDGVQKAMISTYRALRNYTLAPEVQNALVDDESIMQNTRYLLTKLLSREISYATYVKTILQFLCNLTIYAKNKEKILRLLGPILIDLLKHPDFSYVSTALLYNIMKDIDVDLKFIHQNIYNVILELSDKEGARNEYLGFIVELLLGNRNFYSNYRSYDTKERLIVLQNLRECIAKDNFKIDNEFIDILVHQFKIKSDCILKTVADYLKDVEPLEVTYLLETIASLSGNESYLPYLQNDKSLLINCTFLLKSMHELGRSSENCFTSVQKLSVITRPGKDIVEHPAFGFKAGLVRILGNMSWKHRKNQDQLRELDVIPMILDCCNIDARNPLIMQWVILAIRNLCEGNLENQKIVASLTQQGVVDSALLKEMGLTLQKDGNNQITVIPLDAVKNSLKSSKT